jgi:NhaP-type Na+/H+ or K+/H+ antiporter
MTLMYESLALLAAFVLVYSLIAKGVERTWVSGPIVFTAFGLLIGPMGLDLLSFETERETLRTLAELTLALVLFTDAAGFDLGVLRRSAQLPVRLLLIGLPLTIVLGYLIGLLLRAAEGTGDTLALITWVIFGSAVIGQALGYFNWRLLLYALLSLTVIRMLPVFFALSRSGMNAESKLFVGWFGPRGLASIVFAVIVVNAGLPHAHHMAVVVVCTVVFSILAHGITANPWARAYGERMRGRQPE